VVDHFVQLAFAQKIIFGLNVPASPSDGEAKLCLAGRFRRKIADGEGATFEP